MQNRQHEPRQLVTGYSDACNKREQSESRERKTDGNKKSKGECGFRNPDLGDLDGEGYNVEEITNCCATESERRSDGREETAKIRERRKGRRVE